MTASTPTPSLVGGLGLLERAISYTFGSLLEASHADLSRPTPCRGWDLRRLLHHMNDSLAALHEAAETGYVDLTAPPPHSDLDDLIASLQDRACRLLTEWSDSRVRAIGIADLSLASGLVAGAGAIEVAVHGWDVSAAVGRVRPIPPVLAGDLLELALVMVTPEDRPGRFAAPVRLPTGAAAGDRLLGWLGRDVRTWA